MTLGLKSMPEITLSYDPRPAFIPFHQRGERWSCLVCHRRAGKTVACVNDLTTRAVYTSKKNARYGYIAPFYRQAKEIAWVYLKDATVGIAKKVMESTLTVELFNGAKISLFGADNPDALRGLYFDGVVLDEIADMKPSLWGEVILPTLADRKGWAVFIGTPKGKNHFYRIRERAKTDDSWFYMELKSSTSGLLDEEELAEMKRQMDPDQYEQEFECSFEAAVKGTYYASLISELEAGGQIYSDNAEFQPELPVKVAADLGYSDSTAMWFWQELPDGYAIIDYHEAHGQSLEYYFRYLRSKPYEYETIWLPHDARAKTLQTGRSTVEQFIDANFPIRVSPRLSVQDGITAVRKVIRSCHFSTKTEQGVEALRAYRREWDEIKKVFRNQPLHDWASHGSDAFRGFALVAQERIIEAAERSRGPLEFTPAEWRLQELFEANESRKPDILRIN